ncbi:DEAD/DEAH box helicase [Methanobacterium alcaliphilum]|uniref:DEAD/DEAH box helicase n=1 Tax=Methanobacterium alcaliphilum TaxID=392018 RepID=UPI00200B2909|nr:AAA domain-containing protein [Methanobacterium alcaliphilum]MCK9151855.1 AAA domain-containing protein [Methanobacterium alcaliphilum]
MENKINSDFSIITSDIRQFIKLKNNAPKLKAKVVSTHNNQVTIKFNNSPYLNKGSSISINDSIAMVLDYNGYEADLKLNSGDEFFLGDYVEIDDDVARIILNRLEKTLDKIDNHDLKNSSQKILNFLLGKNNPTYDRLILDDLSPNLNESQRISVEKAINAQDFHLIVGPPGTGKTHVIKEIMGQLFKNNQKVLVTAWTNIAVDNILEGLNQLDDDKILRVGSKKDINPKNIKFTLFEKRKYHSDWIEVKDIESEVSYKKNELNKLSHELSLINEEIKPFEDKKKQYNIILSNIQITTNEFESMKSSVKTKVVEDSLKLQEIKAEIRKLELLSQKYVDAAKSIYEVEFLESNLPDTDTFYLIEEELKKLKGKGLVKKISSIFDKNGYEKYHEKLNITEENYNKMVEKYNHYWDLKDLSEEKLSSCYGENKGKPDEDAINYELQLYHKCQMKISLQKEEINKHLKKEKDELLLKSYQIYIESLENKLILMQGEISNLEFEITKKLKKKRYISNLINNLQDYLKNLEMDKKNLISQIDEDIINQSDFVFSTVVSSASFLLNNEHFDVMIMDEASQVASYMALIPLIKCDRFILVGDDRQLQPISEEGLSKKYKESIFNKLIKIYPDSYSLLDTQYRMNKEIASIASNLFYNNQLKTHHSVENQLIDCAIDENISEIISPGKAITLIDTSKIEYYEDGVGKGCVNTKEALIISKLVSYLFSKGIETGDIGVITPFVRQKEKIKETLKENVEVDTVYRFQGREKDIIIFSFCKSQIGTMNKYVKRFIGEPNQLNVAITRARRKLIIVGNTKTLQSSKLLRRLIQSMGKESVIMCNIEHLRLLDLDFSEDNK